MDRTRGRNGLFAALAVAFLAVAGFAVAGFAVAGFAAFPPGRPVPTVAAAQADTDPILTGSIEPAPAPAVTTPMATATRMVPPTPPATKGSEEFRAALDLVAEKDYAAAYEVAKALSDDVERRTIQWAAIYYGNGAIDYHAIQRFAAEAPAFVSASVFKTGLERSLTASSPGKDEVIALLGGEMPITLDAQIALATAYLADGQKGRAARIARDIWTTEFLDRRGETKVLATLGDLLTADDHWARAVHLMMNDRASGVERLMKYLTPAHKSLAVARNAVSRDARNAKALLDKVDPKLQTHPVYLFSRAQQARQAKLYQSAVDWLDKAKGELPDAEQWWYERRTLMRQLLSVGEAKLAYAAADGYRDGPEGRLVEAHFGAGWIALSFLSDPAAAKVHFEAMRKLATLPDSITQANYWLGRALLQLKDAEGAKAAYTRAAGFPTTYYGLLARTELGLKGAELRSMPKWQDAQAVFDANDVVRAVRLLAANGRRDMAEPLLRTYASDLTDGPHLLLAARLAQAIGAHHLAISIADSADKQGVALDLFSFPKDGLPNSALAAIDKAAIYAITRQESRFQANAVSVSGALGLMQLMPETAKETAAKVGIDYSRSRLTSDPAYNALLGSAYLASQLDRYEGSLLLAAAAYNAGAGNANKWIAAFGDPREDHVDPVLWVELIPFQETRKYVQRVLANYLVYRARLGDTEMTLSEALRRIPG
jgi:soluble lytic murein transglycosylase